MNSTLLLQSFRAAFRRPGFFLVVVAVVALSLGLAVAAASLVYEVKLRPLPYADAGRLHVLNSVNRTDGWWEAPGSIAEFKRYEQDAQQDAGMAVFYDQETLTLSANSATEQAERIPVTFVEHNFFPLLGVAPALGRTFATEETARASSHPLAVVSHDFWQVRLGGRADVLGHAIQLNGRTYSIIGVMPARFRDVSLEAGIPAVWLPLPHAVNHLGPEYYSNHSLRRCRALLQIRPGVSTRQAQEEADAIGRRLEAEFPSESLGRGFLVQPVRHYFFWRFDRAVTALFVGSLLVLGLAAVNLANLFLVDGLRRGRELSVRAALGADGRQLAFMVAGGAAAPLLVGGLAGLATGAALLEALRRAAVFALPEFVHLEFSAATLGAALLFLVMVVAASALVPAARARRLDLRTALQSGSKGAAEGGSRGRHALVAAEVSIAATLLVGSGLTLQSLAEMIRRPLGYDPVNLLTMQLQMDRGRLPQREERAAFARRVQETIQGGPGVRAATIFGPSVLGNSNWNIGLIPSHLDPQDPKSATMFQLLNTAPGGLEKLGIRLLRGRDFSPSATPGQPAEVILDERAARRLWPGGDPLGQSLVLAQIVRRPAVVIGIAAPVSHRGRDFVETDATVTGDAYFSYQQFPMDQVGIVLRVEAGAEEAALDYVRRQIARLDPTMAVFDVATMPARLAREEQAPRFTATVFGAYAAISVLLTVIGVYGVLAFGLAQRTREFGVRLAVGAQPRQVIGMVLRETGMWIAGGLVVGLGTASLLAPLLGDLLMGSSPRNPGVLAATGLIIAVAGLFAAFVPAWRASRVDPLVALRSE